MTLTLVLLASLASAQTTPEDPGTWAFGANPYPNVAWADLDGDGLDDQAIGIPGRCGRIELWLSSDDPELGHVRDESPLAEPSAILEPDRCDPLFGLELASGIDASGQPALGTIPDLLGLPLAMATVGPLGVTLTQSSGAAGGSCQCSNCCNYCEPCSGEAPCCNTGGGGGGSMEPFLAE